MTDVPVPDPSAGAVAVIDKPRGWTSHDVVAKSRGVLGTKKVGHSGTLDPDATGVLVLGVGPATRLLRFLTDLPKSYVGEIVMGVETDTLDAAGEVIATHDMTPLDPDEVRRAAAQQLTGPIEQVPPMFSAVKIDGQRLHELARRGETVDRPPRPVTVHRFDVERVPGEADVWRAEVDCSAGTYVRVLAADLGRILGGGAHLRALRRTAVGRFTLDDAGTVDEPRLFPALAAVDHLARCVVAGEVAEAVGHGRVLAREVLGVEGTGPWAVVGSDGALLAVYEPHPAGAKPSVVLPVQR